MDIDNVNIKICDYEQYHFNDYEGDILFNVDVAKVFNMSDIILDSLLSLDINFLCAVLAHECEHIILYELFNEDTSLGYDSICDFCELTCDYVDNLKSMGIKW